MKLEQLEGLDKAIEEFNSWNRSARLYVNLNEGYFNTEVYANDVQATGQIMAKGCYSLLKKNEREGVQGNIGNSRKEYILSLTGLLLEGYDLVSAEYQLF